MGYIFDTNIFIRSKNEMPMEIWPTFWTTLADLINSGEVYSNANVRDEINKGRDELTTWMKANAPKDFYIQMIMMLCRNMRRSSIGHRQIPFLHKVQETTLRK